MSVTAGGPLVGAERRIEGSASRRGHGAWLRRDDARVFERLTQESRQVIVNALEEVKAFGHERVGSEHLLLGLLRNDGVAEILRSFDLTHERVRARVEEIAGPGEESPEGHIPFTPNSKRVLEEALNEAAQLKQPRIAPGHILLGLQAIGDCLGVRVLRELAAAQARRAPNSDRHVRRASRVV